MQSDLISRVRIRTEVDLLLKDRIITPNTMAMLHRLIDEQPTAYSVEDVVAELNKLINEELHSVLKPLPDGTEYPEEAYRLLYLNTRISNAIRNGGKE